MKKVWIRLGGYVTADEALMKRILKGEKAALDEAIDENGFVADGDTYIPEFVDDEKDVPDGIAVSRQDVDFYDYAKRLKADGRVDMEQGWQIVEEWWDGFNRETETGDQVYASEDDARAVMKAKAAKYARGYGHKSEGADGRYIDLWDGNVPELSIDADAYYQVMITPIKIIY